MAIRERPNRKNPWQVYWNNPYTNRRESKAFALREQAEAFDSLIRHRLKFERGSFLPQEYEEEDPRLTFDQAYAIYIKAKGLHGRNLAIQVRNLRPFFEAFGTLPVETITKKDVKLIMDAMRDRGCKQCTVYTRVRHFLAVLNWAVREELIEANPVRDLYCPRGETEVIPPPSTEELALIYSAAVPHLQRAMLIAVGTGLRVGVVELLRIRWGDFNLRGGYVSIHNAKKGQRQRRISLTREVPLKDALLPIFAAWRQQDLELGLDHDYVIHWRLKPIDSFKTAWNKALARAGVKRRIRPYDMRHFFITEALAGGGDLKTVATLAGHTDVQMVLKYYQHVRDSQKQAAVNAVPDIPVTDLGTFWGT